VGLFRRAWKAQQALAVFYDDEVRAAVGSIGEELVRSYMQQAAPKILPVNEILSVLLMAAKFGSRCARRSA